LVANAESRHNSVDVGNHPIYNYMPTTVERSVWKPEVKFQYGDRLHFGTEVVIFQPLGEISVENWCANSFLLS